MKHLLWILLVLFSFGIGHAQKAKNEKLLVGSWKISKVDGNAPSGSDAEMILVFKKDGTLDATDAKNEKNEPGKWKISDDGKTVNITLDSEELPLAIVTLDKSAMKLDREGSIAEFAKVGAAPKTKKAAKPAKNKLKGIAKDVVGTWQASINSEVDVEMPKILIQFNADGTAWTSADSKAATWRVSDDGKQLILNAGREEASDFSMAADKKTMTLKDRGMTITLTRVKDKLSKPEPKKDEPWTEPSYPIEEPVEPIIDEPLPANATQAKEADISGTWKVVAIDSDLLEGRNLIFNIKADKSFDITENGNAERSGKWEFKDNRLYLKDTAGSANNDFSVFKDAEGHLLLKDYYGTFKLKKQ